MCVTYMLCIGIVRRKAVKAGVALKLTVSTDPWLHSKDLLLENCEIFRQVVKPKAESVQPAGKLGSRDYLAISLFAIEILWSLAHVLKMIGARHLPFVLILVFIAHQTVEFVLGRLKVSKCFQVIDSNVLQPLAFPQPRLFLGPAQICTVVCAAKAREYSARHVRSVALCADLGIVIAIGALYVRAAL